MSAPRRKPFLPPAMLLEIAETGGSISADMDVIGARFGMPRRRASEQITQLSRRKLLRRNAERYDVAPNGWAWIESRVPTAARSAPPTRPPPISPPPPRSSSAPPSQPPRKPLNEVQRVRLEKQLKQMRALARLRGVTQCDLGVQLDHPHDGLELGIEHELKPAEYQRLKIMLGCFPEFLPAGFSKDQAKAFRDDFNRPGKTAAERKRKQEKAAAKVATMQKVADLDCRASGIYMVLTDQPQAMVEIMDKVACSPAFRTADGNSLLTGHCLRVAILRELKKPDLAAPCGNQAKPVQERPADAADPPTPIAAVFNRRYRHFLL
jgi:hypothetical protein